jgi:hypothetical protein
MYSCLLFIPPILGPFLLLDNLKSSECFIDDKKVLIWQTVRKQTGNFVMSFLKGKQQGKPLLWYLYIYIYIYIYIYDKRVERVKKKQPSRIYRGEEKRGWIYKKN